jgi:undecaprenyl-diphosphatase
LDKRERAVVATVGRWGFWIAIGVALLLISGFVELSHELFEPPQGTGRILGFDRAILLFVLRVRRAWLSGLAMDMTALGSPLLIGLFTVVLGAMLLLKGDRRGAAALAIASLSSALLTEALKRLLERPRPQIIPRLVEVWSLSYPSGHSLASSAFYLTAALVLARHLTTSRQRASAFVFAVSVTVLVGASRVYLGVHYPSDVIAGILVGGAEAAVLGALLHRFDRKPGALPSRLPSPP